MKNELIKAIQKMFEENWRHLELGSSQTDLVESYVTRTIKEVFKEREEKLQEFKVPGLKELRIERENN
tara:strand:- start:341 stop:544 length:204 start_codon:yes stop_codon:yes gene_type:complete